MSETDRRDRDDLTDRDDLSALCLSFLKPPSYTGGSWTLNPDALAEAIIAAGWVHWPHDCKREAELNEKWQRSEGYDEGYAVGYRAGRNDRTEPET